MPSDLAERITRSCSKRLTASASASALVCRHSPNWAPIEPVWSTRNRKQVGNRRLISAEYTRPPTLEEPDYGLQAPHGRYPRASASVFDAKVIRFLALILCAHLHVGR